MRCCTTSVSRFRPKRYWAGGRAPATATRQQHRTARGSSLARPGGPNDWIYVFARQTDHWHRLLKVLGREELIGDPRYETAQARGERIERGQRDDRRLDKAA